MVNSLPQPSFSSALPLQGQPVPSSPHLSQECSVLAFEHPIKSLTPCPQSWHDSLRFHLIIITNVSWGLVCNRPHAKTFVYFQSVIFPTLNYHYSHFMCLEADLVSSFVSHTCGKSSRPGLHAWLSDAMILGALPFSDPSLHPPNCVPWFWVILYSGNSGHWLAIGCLVGCQEGTYPS